MQASIFAEIPSQLVVKSIRCQYQRGCHALSPPNQSRCNHASRATFAQPSAHEDFQRITRPTVCGNCLGCCRSVKSSGSWLLSVSIYLSEYVRITRRKSCSLSPREIRLRIFHTARSMRYIILKELDWKNISEKKLSVCAALLATCLPKKKRLRQFRDVCIWAIFEEFIGTNIQLPELATINSQQRTVRLCKTSTDIRPESEIQEVSLWILEISRKAFQTSHDTKRICQDLLGANTNAQLLEVKATLSVTVIAQTPSGPQSWLTQPRKTTVAIDGHMTWYKDPCPSDFASFIFCCCITSWKIKATNFCGSWRRHPKHINFTQNCPCESPKVVLYRLKVSDWIKETKASPQKKRTTRKHCLHSGLDNWHRMQCRTLGRTCRFAPTSCH